MKSKGIDVHIIADYICWKFMSIDETISVTKLHKLMYFVQAWHLCDFSEALFNDDFEAWTHGPALPALHKRFHGKTMTLPINKNDIDLDALEKHMTKDVEAHICAVLENYGDLSFMKLEEYCMEHELPWKNARDKMSSFARSNKIIPKEEIMEFYKNMNYVKKEDEEGER